MWFITVFTKIEPNLSSWPEFGYQRTWGFYSDRETAVKALHENWTDMYEYCYNYALIEKFEEGISHYVLDSRQWFKFDHEREGYFEIEEPECVKHLGSFALG
jgi:hypothetical protein